MPTSPKHLLYCESVYEFGDLPYFAVLHLTPSVCRHLLAKVDLAGRVQEEDGTFDEVSFHDSTPAFMAYAAEADNPNAFDEYIEVLLNETSGLELAPEVVPDDLAAAEALDMLTLKVQNRGFFYWNFSVPHDDRYFDTSWLGKDDVVRALFMGTPDTDMPHVLRQYGAEYPDLALRALEGGFQLEGRTGPVREPVRFDRDLLLPFLEHEDSDIRQRAILLLNQTQELAPPTKSRDARRS